jgi:Protein of unknown function (DUF1161)
MLKPLLALLALTVTSSATRANNCQAIQAQIETKMRASGVTQFSLTTIDASARPTARVVGPCDLGAKRFVYAQGTSTSSQSVQLPVRPKAAAMLTECKPGHSVSPSGECKK